MTDYWDEWDDETPLVIHSRTCEGFVAFMNHPKNSGCSPIISDSGTVRGCDADAYYPITHCPWCDHQFGTVAEDSSYGGYHLEFTS